MNNLTYKYKQLINFSIRDIKNNKLKQDMYIIRRDIHRYTDEIFVRQLKYRVDMIMLEQNIKTGLMYENFLIEH